MKRMRMAVALAAVCCGALLGTTAAGAAVAPGETDRSFGDQGLVSLPPVPFYGQDMAIGPEDEIYVLQSAFNCTSGRCFRELSVQRFFSSGAIDPGFGSNGTSAVTPIQGNVEYEYGIRGSLAIAPDGKLVFAAADGGEVSLTRLNRDGSRDLSFGNGGILTAGFGGTETGPQVAVQPDGRIVVATGSQKPQGASVVLARFGLGGELDPSFGAGSGEAGGPGWIAIGGNFTPGGLGLSNGGEIAIGAPRCCFLEPATRVYAARRDPNGVLLGGLSPASPWSSFRVGDTAGVRSAIALPNGKLYLVGVAQRRESGGWRSVPFAAKLLPNGRLDRGFGRAGIVRLKGMNVSGQAPALVDDRGRLLVGGGWNSGEEFTADEALVARLGPSGRPDLTWGGGMSPNAPLSDEISDPLAMGFQSDGRVVVFGERTGECVRSCSVPPRVLIRLFAGDAQNRCRGKRATIVGSNRAETLIGTRGRDVITALAGADTVYGRGGRDLICGGPGHDELLGGGGRDKLFGGGGRDRVRQ